ncbi:MAG: hypothetical protein OIN66_14315 [Candidatus Methanoperedens sp.]|nr:hypothetical protein [Candidatus Methanoperedens sp.]
MPIIRICRERESLTYTGEAFKNAVRQYLESLGYSQTTDSYIEGHLQDMVFVNRDVDPGRLFYVEAKATKVSLRQKDFCGELMDYLFLWLRMPRENRFKLLIFIQEESNPRWWDAILGNEIDETMLREWIEENKFHLSDKKQLEFEDYPWIEMLSFFKETYAYTGPAYRLEIASEEKRKTSAISPPRKAKSLLEESERRNNLINEKCELVSNLLRIELPEYITIIKSKYKHAEEIWGSFDHPFKLEGNILYTFCPPDKSLFNGIALGEPETLETRTLMSSNHQRLVTLINYHLNKILRFRGMRKYKDVYFFEPFYDDNKIVDRYIDAMNGKPRRVARPIFDNKNNSELNYVFHSAVRVNAKIYWDHFYVQISPVRHYTSDGRIPIEGENRDRLDRYFRNPLYNRNSTYLSKIKFWKYYLFERESEDQSMNCWFKRFKFGDFESIGVLGIPQSLDKEQRSLSEYGDGNDS